MILLLLLLIPLRVRVTSTALQRTVGVTRVGRRSSSRWCRMFQNHTSRDKNIMVRIKVKHNNIILKKISTDIVINTTRTADVAHRLEKIPRVVKYLTIFSRIKLFRQAHRRINIRYYYMQVVTYIYWSSTYGGGVYNLV